MYLQHLGHNTKNCMVKILLKLLSEIGDFKFTTLHEGIKKVYDQFSSRYNR